jgi:hypothetical protein
LGKHGIGRIVLRRRKMPLKKVLSELGATARGYFLGQIVATSHAPSAINTGIEGR